MIGHTTLSPNFNNVWNPHTVTKYKF